MISDADIATYLSRVGKRGNQVLELISKLRPFVEAQQTELGRELLKDELEDHAYLFNKIYAQIIKDGIAEQSDVIRLQLSQGRLQKIYDKLQLYNESLKSIKKGEKNAA